MSKILIIGQAPPLKKQTVPYDTTLLYDILGWVGITKEQAQEIFEFEALTDEFPGKTLHGSHNPPSLEMVRKYWRNTLGDKVIQSDKIIILGLVAQKYFKLFYSSPLDDPKVIKLPHPSRRNYSRIMNNKENITNELKEFLSS